MRKGKIVTSVLCSLLLVTCNVKDKDNHHDSKRNNDHIVLSVALQPLGQVASSDLHFIQHVIDSTFSIETRLNAQKELPAMAWYAPRQRYVADSILLFLKRSAISSNEIVMGITTKDIATRKGTEENFGIMGLGHLPGKYCVVSNFRLQKGLLNHQHLQARWAKVALHELGHNLGLPHCADQHCLMVDAEGKNKLDGEMDYCKNCKKQLISSGYLKQ
jgi:archaemetzincin